MLRSLIAVATAATLVAAQQTVQVGSASGNVFTPTTLKAAAGTTVTFNIGPIHNVALSSFAEPCTNAGFKTTVGTDKTYTLNVTDDKPVYIHCAPHCQAGMVFILNPSADKTFEAFQAAAQGKTAPSGTAPPPSGSATTPTGSPTSTPTGGANSIAAPSMFVAALGLLSGMFL